MNDVERRTMVESLKWVDEVIEGVPYELTPAFCDDLFARHRIDLIVHGDDPCLLPDGSDAYATAKARGRFRVIKRTEGVSTTDIVGRALLRTRGDGGGRGPRRDAAELTKQFSAGAGDGGAGGGAAAMTPGTPKAPPPPGAPTAVSRFLPTSRRIVQFSEGCAGAGPGECRGGGGVARRGGGVAPTPATPPTSPTPPPLLLADDRVVYIDGAFDLFHPGHVAALRAARDAGDFLLVGVHTDDDVAARRGRGAPMLDLHERALSVLACRYVDECVIGAPAVITDDLLTTFNIAVVLRGTVAETRADGAPASTSDDARYAVPRARGMLQPLPSPSATTAGALVDRIVANRAAYEARQRGKVASEAAYYADKKAFVEEG
jgi:ethanolamine-phosphate cytidylyltransferase